MFMLQKVMLQKVMPRKATYCTAARAIEHGYTVQRAVFLLASMLVHKAS
jgi:hypothetical protein